MGGCDTILNVRLPAHGHGLQHGGWREDLAEGLAGQSTECAPVAVGAEHPLFILYNWRDHLGASPRACSTAPAAVICCGPR